MRFLLVFVLIFSLPVSSFAADYKGNCTISFQGTSTLHDIHGKARCQPFTVNNIDGVIDMSGVSVAIADMDTGNSKRDKQMREMFEDKTFPMITGNAGMIVLNDIRAGRKNAPGSAHKISFKLKIRNIVKPVTATVTNFVETDSRITADIAFTLSLAEYQLKPPTVLGLIKVDDKVAVTAAFVLKTSK